MRPHVSYSELGLFVNVCQWRWKLDYIDKVRDEAFSIHFDFGHAVHEAMENYLTRKDPVDVEKAVLIYQESLDRLYTEHKEKYEKKVDEDEFQKLRAGGERIIRAIKDTPELKDVEVIYNEYPLFEPIDRTDQLDIKFKGFIDLVIKGKDGRGKPILYVCDFKTCSWGWDRETREDRWKHYQVFLYKYYLCKKFNIDPKGVRCAFILLKKRPPKGTDPVEFFPVSAGPVSVQRALDALNSSITEMAEGETKGYKKNRSMCVDKYNNTCPYKGTAHCPDD